MSRHPSPERLTRVDDLPPEERERLLGHVRGCASCRSIWAATDPTRLFALLADQAIPQALLDSVSAGVVAGIDAQAPGSRGSEPAWARRAVVAVAASVLLAFTAVYFTSSGPRFDVREGMGEGVSRVADVHGITPGAQLVLLDSPGDAQVMDLTVGETQVVMIFDREFDI